jgi:hypothetical protein
MTGDLKVLQRPRGLDAVVGVRRDGLFAEKVFLEPGRSASAAGGALGRRLLRRRDRYRFRRFVARARAGGHDIS